MPGDTDALRSDAQNPHPDDDEVEELRRLMRQQEYAIIDLRQQIKFWRDKYEHLRATIVALSKRLEDG